MCPDITAPRRKSTRSQKRVVPVGDNIPIWIGPYGLCHGERLYAVSPINNIQCYTQCCYSIAHSAAHGVIASALCHISVHVAHAWCNGAPARACMVENFLEQPLQRYWPLPDCHNRHNRQGLCQAATEKCQVPHWPSLVHNDAPGPDCSTINMMPFECTLALHVLQAPSSQLKGLPLRSPRHEWPA